MECTLPSDALTFVDSHRLPRLFTLNTAKTCLKKQSQTPPTNRKNTFRRPDSAYNGQIGYNPPFFFQIQRFTQHCTQIKEIRMKKLLLPLAAAFLLAACATPQTNYFTLPDSTFQMPEHTRGKTETALRVVPAEPLNRGGLAYRSDAFRLDYARNHLWAQPLDQAAAARFARK